MQEVHIVWDWNGTLLADLPYVLDAVSRSVARYGLPPIDGDEYRDHFTRPVRMFYDSLFGRPVTDMEWVDLNKTFHEYYYEVVDDIELAPGARAALDTVADHGWGQSLLSMSMHTQLGRTVTAHGIAHRFQRIDGLLTADGGRKAIHLKSHLAAMNVDPNIVYLVGDTPDDYDAALSVGSGIVLYDGGSHHRPDLDRLGAPVVDSLSDAITVIRAGLGS